MPMLWRAKLKIGKIKINVKESNGVVPVIYLLTGREGVTGQSSLWRSRKDTTGAGVVLRRNGGQGR
jgi:hypothetical protein